MQRKAILVLLLLCSFCAWAQKKKQKAHKKHAQVTATPAATPKGGVGAGVSVQAGQNPDVPPAPGSVDFKAVGSPMPPIRVVYPNKAVYTGETLKNDANLFVMLFNPTCEHCEDMAFALKKNIDLFQKSHIVLMAAPTMGPYLEFFENGTKVQNYPKIKMGLDSANFINNTFTYDMLPQINVYDADRKLLRIFNGITTIDSLRQYIQ